MRMIHNDNPVIKAGRVLLAIFVIIAMLPAVRVFAASEKTDTDEPVREVHNVVVNKKAYCFFVDHYVVLTPADTADKTDSELTEEIIRRAGLYMKEANCKATVHKVIKTKDWIKKGGSFSFSSEDLESIRQAQPTDGNPAKFSLDLKISTESADEQTQEDIKKDESETTETPETEEGEAQPGEETAEDQEGGSGDDSEPGNDDSIEWYSTFKRTSPRLFFVVVATEADAKYGEDICEVLIRDDENRRHGRRNRPADAGEDGEAEDILPEYRTIAMVDRTGAPIEPTLEDGSPVTLEWIDPDKHQADSSHNVRTGYIAAAAVLALSAAAASYIVMKRKSR